MAVSQIPPAPDTYKQVLRIYHRDSSISWPLVTYNLTLPSLDIELFGVRAPTLFVPLQGDHDPDTVAKTAMLFRNGGWKDETARWHAQLEGETDPEAPAALPTPDPVAVSEPKHPALTAKQIASFGWQQLQKEAAKRGVKARGRPAIEEALRNLQLVAA